MPDETAKEAQCDSDIEGREKERGECGDRAVKCHGRGSERSAQRDDGNCAALRR